MAGAQGQGGVQDSHRVFLVQSKKRGKARREEAVVHQEGGRVCCKWTVLERVGSLSKEKKEEERRKKGNTSQVFAFRIFKKKKGPSSVFLR
jgi:hypothetical protein